MLTEIKNKIEKVDPNVDYGVVDKARRETVWNYIVFNRVALRNSANKTGKGDLFDVHIVRENYIPDGLAESIISKLTEIPGVRETSEDGAYEYMVKPNTNTVVEMLTLHFVRARKNV